MPVAQRIAFVCPRFSKSGTVGGAETLLKNLAEHCAHAGRKVTFLTTCARDHFTWANELPAETYQHAPNMEVKFFPVATDRNLELFLRVQDLINRSAPYTLADEQDWLASSVHSPELCAHLTTAAADYDRVVAGPYLFGLTYQA